MKILYVCTSTEVGGAERAFFTLAQAAFHAGHEVNVLSLRPLGPLGRQLQEAGLSVESLDLRGKYRPLETAGALARLVAQIQAGLFNFAAWPSGVPRLRSSPRRTMTYPVKAMFYAYWTAL